MSPLEQIKHGILSNDMELVKKGYQGLTGEQMEAEKPAKQKKVAKLKKTKTAAQPKKNIFGKIPNFVTDNKVEKDDPRLYQNTVRREQREKVVKQDFPCKKCNKMFKIYPSQAAGFYCTVCQEKGILTN